jgi:hypothetical protein
MSHTIYAANGKVKKRKFAMDMAGFALNVEVLWKYHPIRFNTTSNRGFQETNFLEICCTPENVSFINGLKLYELFIDWKNESALYRQ